MWLSEAPDVFASKLELSGCTRVATWATLKNKESGKVYTHINTHLDHILEEVRVEQVKILETKLEELKAQGYPVICTGDFNTFETAEAYAEMRKTMDDVKLLAENSDTGITFHKYGTIEEHEDGAIDFVFATKGTKALTYKIIRDSFDGIYPSDHYPVVADILL
jgi:endonuclease/exonuclease/phosphatase family metal-dependent hydrolase